MSRRRVFTDASSFKLIQHVEEQLGQFAAQWRRDRWFFLGSQRTLSHPILPVGWEWSDQSTAAGQQSAQIKQVVTGSRALASRRAPGLSAQIRMRWIGQSTTPNNANCWLLVDFRQYPLITEHQLTQAAQYPVLVDPLRHNYRSHKTWQDACRANARAWEVHYGQQARVQRNLQRDGWTPLKKLTIRVWLDHARNPYRAIRTVPDGLKQSGWTLARWQQYLLGAERKARKGKLGTDQGLHAWKWLCLAPSSRPEDRQFLLLLYLLQEQMIDQTPAVSRFLRGFVAQFRRARHVGGVDLFEPNQRKYVLAGGGLPFEMMLRHFVLPEDWRTLRKYMRRMIQGLWLSEQRDAAQEGHRVDWDVEELGATETNPEPSVQASSASDVPEAAEMPEWDLSDQSAEPWGSPDEDFGRAWETYVPQQNYIGQGRREDGYGSPGTVDQTLLYLRDVKGILVSRSSLYGWIKMGKIEAVLDDGRQTITGRGLEQVIQLVTAHQQRKAVRGLGELRGWKPESIKKFIQRHQNKGESLQDIARIIRQRPHESEDVEESST